MFCCTERVTGIVQHLNLPLPASTANFVVSFRNAGPFNKDLLIHQRDFIAPWMAWLSAVSFNVVECRCTGSIRASGPLYSRQRHYPTRQSEISGRAERPCPVVFMIIGRWKDDPPSTTMSNHRSPAMSPPQLFQLQQLKPRR